MSGAPYLQWTPLNFAAQYSVEVYRNGDTNSSPSNLVQSAVTKFAAWAPVASLPAGTYAWRVQAIDADFYVFTGHKLYGPTGIGVLYAKAERLAEMAPYQGGGEMIASVSMDEIRYADGPHRFEAGTPPILEAIGLGAACEWLMAQDRAAIAAHEHALYERAMQRLEGRNWFKVLGTTPGKAAILSFTVESAHAHDVAQILDRYGVAVRAGTHCAEPLMRRFGVTSSARASFALYNTLEEADAFADALIKVKEFFA